MSAFIVGQDHIDFLVTAAVDLSTGHGSYALYWNQFPGIGSASYSRVDLGNADAFGRMLWSENIASVQYLYRGSWDDVPDAEQDGPNSGSAALVTLVWPLPSALAVQISKSPAWLEA